MGVQVTNAGGAEVWHRSSQTPLGVTLYWGRGDANLHLSPDTYLPYQDAEDLRVVGLQQGQAAWEAALPQSWSAWYFSVLNTGRRLDVFEGYIHARPFA